ncbi:hypothetical protein J437_LFUL018287 [Ladona fulva]|uniref:Uncharacterized protein n=1 Tax=Ladona fulva TaxID=123851 RepID=A0A8K0P4S9_LADFU|nr:hypothetical protein J437_LFUL018287 [Ladona fulva]
MAVGVKGLTTGPLLHLQNLMLSVFPMPFSIANESRVTCGVSKAVSSPLPSSPSCHQLCPTPFVTGSPGGPGGPLSPGGPSGPGNPLGPGGPGAPGLPLGPGGPDSILYSLIAVLSVWTLTAMSMYPGQQFLRKQSTHSPSTLHLYLVVMMLSDGHCRVSGLKKTEGKFVVLFDQEYPGNNRLLHPIFGRVCLFLNPNCFLVPLLSLLTIH